MKLAKRPNILKNEKGMALLETVPLLVIFAMLISFALGLFGYIHTGILYSISARAHAFETFRNRTNLTYFRENLSGLDDPQHYANKGFRVHLITAPNDPRLKFTATAMPIRIGAMSDKKGSTDSHNQGIFSLQARNQNVEVNPAWLMISYGICINYNCGDKR